MTDTLRILHISDVHFRAAGERDAWRRDLVLGDAWKNNLDAILRDGRGVDLVCFTGDLAFSGQKPEYDVATPWVAALLERLGLGWDRFLPVPGNHDVDRNRQKTVWSAVRDATAIATPHEVDRWAEGRGSVGKVKTAHLHKLLERSRGWRGWLTRVGLGRLAPRHHAHGLLGYRESLTVRAISVHIVGLDSAWCAGDNNDQGKLWLTDSQIGRLLRDSAGATLDGIRIALMHHALSDLVDERMARERLAGSADLLLHGHRHEAAALSLTDPDCSLPVFAAGCLYEHDRWPNAFSVYDLVVGDDGRVAQAEVLFRRWAGKHWHNDNGAYEACEDGRLRLGFHPGLHVIETEPPPPVADIHPGVADLFVGREPELLELERHLLTASGESAHVAICAVQGMPGVGKTYLADRFVHLHRAEFPGGVVRIVLAHDDAITREALHSDVCGQLDLRVAASNAESALRARLRAPRTLLHLENVDHEDAATAVAQLANGLRGCVVVVTGRHQGLGTSPGWRRIEVLPLSLELALEQLSQEIGACNSAGHGELERMADSLGRLPLALHLAAGHLRAGMSAPGFLKELRRRGLGVGPAQLDDPLLTGDRARAILSTTFDLSLDALRAVFERRQQASLYDAFAGLSHGPPGGFGRSLGGAIANVEGVDMDVLIAEARRLSLLDVTPTDSRKDPSWTLHPLLAEYVRGQSPELASLALTRATDWFVGALRSPDQSPIHHEHGALVHWLERVPAERLVEVERAGAQTAARTGPFAAWIRFCTRILRADLTDHQESGVLWTLANVAIAGGELELAETTAKRKAELDGARGEEREVALARGLAADLATTRGDLDEALRIRREEELPVYQRLGDVRSVAVCRTNIAVTLANRGQRDDGPEIRRLLEAALADFESLGVPEAEQVRNIQRQIFGD